MTQLYSNGYGLTIALDSIVDTWLSSAESSAEQQDRFVALAEAAYQLLTDEQKLQLVNAITPFTWKPA